MADLLQVLSMLAIPTIWMLTCRYLVRRQDLRHAQFEPTLQ